MFFFQTNFFFFKISSMQARTCSPCPRCSRSRKRGTAPRPKSACAGLSSRRHTRIQARRLGDVVFRRLPRDTLVTVRQSLKRERVRESAGTDLRQMIARRRALSEPLRKRPGRRLSFKFARQGHAPKTRFEREGERKTTMRRVTQQGHSLATSIWSLEYMEEDLGIFEHVSGAIPPWSLFLKSRARFEKERGSPREEEGISPRALWQHPFSVWAPPTERPPPHTQLRPHPGRARDALCRLPAHRHHRPARIHFIMTVIQVREAAGPLHIVRPGTAMVAQSEVSLRVPRLDTLTVTDTRPRTPWTRFSKLVLQTYLAQ